MQSETNTGQRCIFIGRTTIDLMSFVEEMPGPDQKTHALADFIGGGGSSLNAAVVCQALGSQAELYTSLGAEHIYKSIVCDELNRYKVSVRDLCMDSKYQLPLSNIISACATANRLIVNASQPDCEIVASLEPQWLEGAALIQLDQYELPFVKANQTAIQEFPGEIVLDGGTWKPHSELYLSLCTLPIVSEEFTGGDVELMQRLCDQHSIARWAMTLGKKGVIYCDASGRGQIAAPKIPAIDTLGAGDIFHGTFCHFYASGWDFRAALERANEIAALSCTQLGTRTWLEQLG